MSLIEKALAVNEDRRMLESELELIQGFFKEFYKGGNTLEIGAYKGMTTYLLAGLMSQYKDRKPESKHYVIDIFNQENDAYWRYEHHSPDMLLENVKDFKDLVEVKQSDSLNLDGIGYLFDRQYDMIFIDGDHRWPTVLMELSMADYLTENITGHDYGQRDVTRSVDEFCQKRGYKVIQPNGAYGIFKIDKNPK